LTIFELYSQLMPDSGLKSLIKLKYFNHSCSYDEINDEYGVDLMMTMLIMYMNPTYLNTVVHDTFWCGRCWLWCHYRDNSCNKYRESSEWK